MKVETLCDNAQVRLWLLGKRASAATGLLAKITRFTKKSTRFEKKSLDLKSLCWNSQFCLK